MGTSNITASTDECRLASGQEHDDACECPPTQRVAIHGPPIENSLVTSSSFVAVCAMSDINGSGLCSSSTGNAETSKAKMTRAHVQNTVTPEERNICIRQTDCEFGGNPTDCARLPRSRAHSPYRGDREGTPPIGEIRLGWSRRRRLPYRKGVASRARGGPADSYPADSSV